MTKLKTELEDLRQSFKDETMNAVTANQSGGEAKKKKMP